MDESFELSNDASVVSKESIDSPSSASRSTIITFKNNTSQPLARFDVHLDHGIWSDNLYPPEKIMPNAIVQWASESQGMATGTQGYVKFYAGGSTDIVSVGWDNPYWGSNNYNKSCPSNFSLSYEGGSGDNATVTFTLKPA